MKNFKNNKIVIIFLALIIFSELIILLRFSDLVQNFEFKKSFRDCTRDSYPKIQKGQCLRNLAALAYKKTSILDISSDLKSVNDSNKIQWCHEFMHYLGWEAYKDSGDLFTSFRKATETCDFGMYHGIVEEYLEQSSVGSDIEDFVKLNGSKICEESTKGTLEVYKGICYHGLGHGFMFVTGNDLSTSAGYCGILPVDKMESCLTGVFMENIQSKQVTKIPVHPSKFAFNHEDPDFPCKELNKKFKNICYRYKGVFEMNESKGNLKLAFENCLKVDSSYHNSCFFGIGVNIPGSHITSDAAGRRCRAALEVSGKAYEQCVIGGLSFIAELSTGDSKELIKFCDSVDANFKGTCYDHARLLLKIWGKFDSEIVE
jgi:hypothetical protein